VEQLNLLPLPKQRPPKEVEISSRVIRQYVRDRLQGYQDRQEIRESRRAGTPHGKQQVTMFHQEFMTTAKEFAAASVSMRQLSIAMKPADSDPYAQQRKLIQFHLQSAATKTQEIAEALAQKEKTA